jgi:hypothetical protein
VWAPFGTDLPAVPAYDISVNPQGNKLLLATHGRGIYVLALKHAIPKETSGGGKKSPGGGGGLAGTGLDAAVPTSAVVLIGAGLALVMMRRRRA